MTAMARHVPLVLAALAAIFLVAPLAIIVPMSFSKAISFEFPPPGYWTGYYSQYFASRPWLDATANSFIIAFGSTVFTLTAALPAAFGFVRYRFRGKGAINLLMMLPIIVPAIVSALGYYSFLGPVGLVGTHAGMIIAHSVLSVPVAALRALPEGGYGVEIIEGDDIRLLPVTTGLFARGQVEIRGEGVVEGAIVGIAR